MSTEFYKKSDLELKVSITLELTFAEACIIRDALQFRASDYREQYGYKSQLKTISQVDKLIYKQIK